MTTYPWPASSGGGVLVASASSSLREQVLSSLHHRNWQVQEASGGADALVKLEKGSWQLLFLDRRLPDLDAEELIEIIKRRFPGIEVVMLDSDGGPTLGAAGWANFSQGRSRQTETPIQAGLSRDEKGGETTEKNSDPLPDMIGRAAAIQRIYELVRLVAPRPTTVLITGATGTGKELVARALHRLSPRSARPFMVVNCAAIPETLLEAELFGYTRGAFTGAVQAYSGRIQAAQGGTLFLDEVGELPLGLQAKLLRFLDQKEIQRLGSSDTVRVDVRVVAATNADLAEAVERGQFRSDLYYRLTAPQLQNTQEPDSSQIAEPVVPLASDSSNQTNTSNSGVQTDNMFLTLLTEQLKSQSPFDPVDPEQFVGQLVQFNTLDQLIQIRQILQQGLETPAQSTNS